MTWFMGRDVEAYISTENPAYGISMSNGTAVATAWNAASLVSDFVVPPLMTQSFGWDGTETDATNAIGPLKAAEFTALEGVDLKVGAEREDVNLIGRIIEDHIRLRDTFDLTIVKKMSNPDWACLYKQADGGLDSTNAINPADDETDPSSGYRLFVKIDNGGESLWFTGRNCTLTDYTPGTPAVKSLTETFVIKSNLVNVGTGSYITATAATEL